MSLIHKTCASWGVTNCNKQLFVQRPPRVTERWDRTTCPKCLTQRPKKKRNGTL